MTKAQKIKELTRNVVKTVDSKDSHVGIIYLGSIPPNFEVISKIKTGEARVSKPMKRILKKAIGADIKGDIYFEQYPHFKGKETSGGEVGWCMRIQERRLGYVWCQFLVCLEGVVNYETEQIEDYIRIYEFYDPKEFNFYRLTKDEKLFFGEAEAELKSLGLYITRDERMRRKIDALAEYRANREFRIHEKLQNGMNRVLQRTDEKLKNVGTDEPSSSLKPPTLGEKKSSKGAVEVQKKATSKHKEKMLKVTDDDDEKVFDTDFDDIKKKNPDAKKQVPSKKSNKPTPVKKENSPKKLRS